MSIVQWMSLLNILDDSDDISSYLIFQIANHVDTMESIMKAEFTHGYDSRVIPKLQESFAIFHWCFRAITLCDVNPTLKVILNSIVKFNFMKLCDYLYCFFLLCRKLRRCWRMQNAIM